jgi:hypothetical protein
MRSLVVAFAVLAPSVAFACGMRFDKTLVAKSGSLDDIFAEIDDTKAANEVTPAPAPTPVEPVAPVAPVAAPVPPVAPAQPAS